MNHDDMSARYDPTERAVDAALRRLPTPRAPQTLLPRVMASVQTWALRPWYARAWVTWPVGWQAASIAALLLMVGGGALLLPLAREAAAGGMAMVSQSLPDRIGHLGTRASALAGYVEAAVRAGSVLVRTLLAAVMAPAFVVMALMSLACAAFGAALSHVVLNSETRRFAGKVIHR